MEESPSDIPGGLFNMVYYITGGWEVDGLKEQELYQTRKNNIEVEIGRASQGFPREKKKYMAEQEEKIEKPLTYEYSDGYQEAGTQMVFVGLLQTLLIAICIPSIFAEEHIRKDGSVELMHEYGEEDAVSGQDRGRYFLFAGGHGDSGSGNNNPYIFDKWIGRI